MCMCVFVEDQKRRGKTTTRINLVFCSTFKIISVECVHVSDCLIYFCSSLQHTNCNRRNFLHFLSFIAQYMTHKFLENGLRKTYFDGTTVKKHHNSCDIAEHNLFCTNSMKIV